MSFDWSHYIDIAHELFRQSSNSVHTDADLRCSISRAFKHKNHRKIAANLNRMRIDRNLADYTDSVPDLKDMAIENLKRANQVVSELSQI